MWMQTLQQTAMLSRFPEGLALGELNSRGDSVLRDQERQVLSRYRAQGVTAKVVLRKGPWSALVLERAVH